MHREQRGHHEAAPGVSRRAFQHPEEQRGIERMKQHVLVVMKRRVGAEELEIERMRQPGKRMPVCRIAVSEGPEHGARRQAILNVRIVGDVVRVVEIEEGMTMDRRVERKARAISTSASTRCAQVSPSQGSSMRSGAAWARTPAEAKKSSFLLRDEYIEIRMRVWREGKVESLDRDFRAKSKDPGVDCMGAASGEPQIRLRSLRWDDKSKEWPLRSG